MNMTGKQFPSRLKVYSPLAGIPMTVTLKGKVEPYFKDQA